MSTHKLYCEQARRDIKSIADSLNTFRRGIATSLAQQGPRDVDAGEVVANATLAYRHLEDASMRLGKAIRALNGGVSVYDRTQVPGA